MKDTVIIENEKLIKIIKFASEEISNKDDYATQDTIASHIVEKMKEVLKDDN